MATNKGEDMAGNQRFIDAKLPLAWLIGCAVSIVFSLGIVYNKLGNLEESNKTIENKIDKRDESINALQAQIIATQGKDALQDIQINRNQSDISNMQSSIEAMRSKLSGGVK